MSQPNGRHRPPMPAAGRRRKPRGGWVPLYLAAAAALLVGLVGGAWSGTFLGDALLGQGSAVLPPPPVVTATAAEPGTWRRDDPLGGADRAHIGKVVAVPDGESAMVALPEGTARVWVAGVDAPTGSECGAAEATAHARRHLLDQEVALVPELVTPEEPGRPQRYLVLATQLSYTDAAVRDGVARADARPVRYRPIYVAEEAGARDAGRGVWGACSS